MKSVTHHTVMVGDDPMTAEEIDYTIDWATFTEEEDGVHYMVAEPDRFYSGAEDYYWNDYLDTPFTKAVMQAWVDGDIDNNN